MEKNKLVLLAYCLENKGRLVDMAKERRLNVEVLINDDYVFEIIKQYNAKYIVGACYPAKIDLVTLVLNKRRIGYQAIPIINNVDKCYKEDGVVRKINVREYEKALGWLCRQGNS